MKLPEINPLEIIICQSLVSPSAVALSIYGLNPYMANKDIPAEFSDALNNARQIILYNVRACIPSEYGYANIRTDTAVPIDIAFGCAYFYKDKTGVPDLIKNRIESALDNIYSAHKKNNEWEKYFSNFGGVDLINKTKSERKGSGQGNYRKNDELVYSYKLAGLFLELLKEKNKNGCSPSNRYSNENGKSIQKNIYDDICSLANRIDINLIGIGKSSFSEKINKIENIMEDYKNQS
ncbi:TPA: hypothetical protein QIE17_003274 [Morganella morganii subsp. morganii]|nr:hypothetical protein [Morganella morganii subsp. morganii]